MHLHSTMHQNNNSSFITTHMHCTSLRMCRMHRYTWQLYSERLMTLSGVYGFWKYVSNLERRETRRYLEMFYALKYRNLVRLYLDLWIRISLLAGLACWTSIKHHNGPSLTVLCGYTHSSLRCRQSLSHLPLKEERPQLMAPSEQHRVRREECLSWVRQFVFFVPPPPENLVTASIVPLLPPPLPH